MASKVKNRLAVLNVVGLTSDLLKRGLPRLNQLADQGVSRLIQPALPAVTCTAQSNYSQFAWNASQGTQILGNIIAVSSITPSQTPYE